MAIRGQRLYIRPITPDDLPELRRLRNSPDMPLPAAGLLGKLVGETVSFLILVVDLGREIRIEECFVAPELRRKGIGRAMILELEELGRRLECPELIVAHDCSAREFFLRLGFVERNSVLRKLT